MNHLYNPFANPLQPCHHLQSPLLLLVFIADLQAHLTSERRSTAALIDSVEHVGVSGLLYGTSRYPRSSAIYPIHLQYCIPQVYLSIYTQYTYGIVYLKYTSCSYWQSFGPIHFPGKIQSCIAVLVGSRLTPSSGHSTICRSLYICIHTHTYR